MPVDPRKRAETARRNGAKSRGPVTPEGKEKCAQAASSHQATRRAIALAFECTLLPNESRPLLESLTRQEFAFWQPTSPNEVQLVLELVDVNWKIKRIRFAQNHALSHSVDTQRRRDGAPGATAGHVAQALIEACAPGGEQLHFDRSIHLLATTRTRILRDLQRSQRRFPNRAGSQPVLQTNNFCAEFEIQVPPQTPAEPALPWAQSQLDFHPDPAQAEILASDSKDILVLGARQTGKSTAAAVRALHEAVHNDGATILVAGPSIRQSGQILTIARQFATRAQWPLSAAPKGCEGFRLANGSQIISLPENDTTIRGFLAPRLIIIDDAAFVSVDLITALRPMLAVSNGTMLLLSTPNTKSGYFYENWRHPDGPWHKIQCTAAACPRLTPEVLDKMRASMTANDFAREFDCVFLDLESGIPSELFRRNLRTGIQPMFEEENE